MDETIQFLIRHGYALLFGWVFTRIHPLAGGIDAWLENKFPFEPPAPLKSAAAVSVAARPSAAEGAKRKGKSHELAIRRRAGNQNAVRLQGSR